ncbi:Asp-tRNA(Asn)/Glu-tRNA(Gln) amidotransferase subunit GatC [Candidatus Collierbacteria bacterium]|nr:Asp-tRNA(Asn)/Glu-tRNA(Gln) amidotransferase subunit GatC [Candidatus Collierbacteria bacterium]
MAKITITTDDVAKIGVLANLPVSEDEKNLFADQFSMTIDVIGELNEIDTNGIVPTSQVNHLENVTRPDEIDSDRILTQAEALSGAKNVHQGFFVVKQVLEKDSE